jgi:hypothetical protein
MAQRVSTSWCIGQFSVIENIRSLVLEKARMHGFAARGKAFDQQAHKP